MPGIRTPSGVSAIHGDGSDTVKEDISYCESCHAVGIKSILHKRLWVFNTETKEIEQVADEDKDRFRQCYNCGDVVPIYEVKTEAKITDFVETTDDPFDDNPGNMKTFGKTPSQSVGLKKYKNKRKTHSDPEIQEFLNQGNEVENIMET